MKRNRFGLVDLMIVAAIVSMLAVLGMKAFALDPATITFTNFRDKASIELAADAKYWQGDKIRFTNMVAFSGAATNSARENLTGCSVTVVLGDSTSNLTYSGSAQNPTAGVWTCDGTVPAVDPCYIQVTLTDTNTGTNYTYWTSKIQTSTKLGD
jgi:Tfp pilus assembly major pilin PilA